MVQWPGTAPAVAGLSDAAALPSPVAAAGRHPAMNVTAKAAAMLKILIYAI